MSTNPFIATDGTPTSLAVLMEYIRSSGEYDMIFQFEEALGNLRALWWAATGMLPPYRRENVTVKQYTDAYAQPKWQEQCRTLLREHGTIRNIIQKMQR